jgi:hypothetical protein
MIYDLVQLPLLDGCAAEIMCYYAIMQSGLVAVNVISRVNFGFIFE